MYGLSKATSLVCAILLLACAALWVGASTTGIVTGVVKSAKDQTALSGVNVIIEGTNLSTVTDAEGRFTITNVPPGEYEVRLEMVGFATATIGGIQVTMDEKASVNVELKEEATKEEEVVVTRPRPMVAADVVNTLNLVTARQEPLTRLDPASIRTAPGVLSALPGVVVEPSGSGQMHVRGGKADQTGWYLEGIPITDPNTGMFGTNLYTTGVSKFQSYTGGFGAEYGNAISGVLNEVKKTGADTSGVRMSLEGGNESYRDGFVEFGAGTAETFNYYVGAAAQATDLDGPVVKQQEYHDAVTKLVWPSKNNSVTLLALQGSLLGHPDTYHDTGDNGVATLHELDFMQQQYMIGAVTWSHNFSPSSFINIRPYYLNTDIQQNLVGKYGVFARISSSRTGVQVNYTGQMSPRHLLKVGGSMMSADNNYYLYPGFPFYRADVNTSQTDLYIQDQMKLTDKWTFDAGLRRESITYDREGHEYVAGAGYSGASIPDATETHTTPRMGLSYAPDERTAWKVSWGRYMKFVPSSSVQKTYIDPDATPFGPGTPTLEQMMPGLGATAPETSTNFELSFERQLSDSTALRVTPFKATYENLGDTYVDPNTGVSTYTNVGEGESSGVEAMFRKKMSDNWQGWLSYTYQRTEANRADLGYVNDMYCTSWDQRHTLSLVTDYRTGRWSHMLRADYGSGRADVGDPTIASRARASLILSYGFSVDLPESWSGVGQRLYLSIYNLLDNKQTLQHRWDPGPTRVTDSWVPARFISVGVSKEF